MSRIKEVVNRPFHFIKVRDVFLNRNGIKIGEVVVWNNKRCYLTFREAEHYFRIHHGYGLDRGLFWNMVKEDKVELIIIQYKGVKGIRYFIGTIDDWAMYSVPVSYTKEIDSNTIETYGNQIVLDEDYMTEYEVRSNYSNI